ncbi:MAG: arginine--tRNA ligase [Saprospiraceae bacterium]|nr:arginine--tRNA ligase [Saprospiraceae bacterium]
MNITSIIQQSVIEAVQELYGAMIASDSVQITATRKDFQGDYTVVTFPFTKLSGKKPEDIGIELGNFLVARVPHITDYNVVKGFLNLVISDRFWIDFLQAIYENEDYGCKPLSGEKAMVEFSSPNTNKPLHLGHIRNILLGWSTYKILEASGFEVTRVQIVNDRGIAICKSMLAWQKFGEGATPESSGIKSDHFVGRFYVLFEKRFKEEYKAWQQTEPAKQILAPWLLDAKNLSKAAKWAEDEKKKLLEKGLPVEEADFTPEAYFFKEVYKNTYFNEYSALGKEAKAMLLRWEAGDPATLELWRQMNSWVYAGFNDTYNKLGVVFDKLYFESDTYLLGKDTVEEGLQHGVFYKKPDGSVWIDLEDAGLDHKVVLRSDGTSVYITQDIGTAQLRYRDFGVKRMIYVVADEQNYHFQVLFEIMKRLKEPYSEGLHHLSYGMVDLPSGKMKSREGTVVDADDLIAEVIQEARNDSSERDTLADLSVAEQNAIMQKIGLAALKFHIIKVHPKKRMTFDPKESVDLQGQTGPYIQNAYVRIRSVIRKAEQLGSLAAAAEYAQTEPAEKELLAQLYAFPEVIETAGKEYDPSHIAAYCYNLAKLFHRFYHDHSILGAANEAARDFRLMLSMATGNVLRKGMDLLGIEMPDRM